MSKFFSHPVHDLPRYATKYEIFVALLPPAFLNDVLKERAHDRDGCLSFNKGNKNVWTVEASEDLAIRIITVWLQVHSCMDKQVLYKKGSRAHVTPFANMTIKWRGRGLCRG